MGMLCAEKNLNHGLSSNDGAGGNKGFPANCKLARLPRDRWGRVKRWLALKHSSDNEVAEAPEPAHAQSSPARAPC